jgi:hypothetical protein
MCAAGEDTYEKREAIFKEFHERMMSAFLNDEAEELLNRIEASPSLNRRRQRKKEGDENIERVIAVVKKTGSIKH